jgi:hypothetical protein
MSSSVEIFFFLLVLNSDKDWFGIGWVVLARGGDVDLQVNQLQ